MATEESIKKDRITKVLENIYLVLFVVFLSYIIITDNTMVDFAWPKYFYQDLRALLLIVIFLRAGYSGCYTKKDLILVGMFGTVLLLDYNRIGSNLLYNTFLLILGAKGISFRKLLSIYLIVTVSLVFVTNVCSIFGLIENLVYVQGSRHRRMALGFTYPTNFAALVFSCVAVYIYLRGTKIKYKELLFLIGVGGLLYWITDARTNVMCIFMLVAVVFYYKLRIRFAQNKETEYNINPFCSTILALTAVLCAGFMIVLTTFYSSGSELWKLLDKICNTRLSLGHKAIDVYGFSLWGQNIPQTSNSRVSEGLTRYYFLDSSYVRILMMYGILVFAIIMIIWTITMFTVRQKNDFILLWILAIISLQFAFESRMLQIEYNPFLWCMLANIDQIWPEPGWQNRLELRLKGQKDVE